MRFWWFAATASCGWAACLYSLSADVRDWPVAQIWKSPGFQQTGFIIAFGATIAASFLGRWWWGVILFAGGILASFLAASADLADIRTERISMADTLNLSEILADLYDSEINASVSWFWDAGIDVALGDGMNGYEAHDQIATFADAAEWLRAKTVEHYPDSIFGRKYARGFE
jgi:hypothetical protein